MPKNDMLLKTRIPLSYTFGKIKVETLIILAYSILVWALYDTFEFARITIPVSVPAILGTVISLLLGFRSNQAYDRWWEARHIWGAIVNDSRSLARQAVCFTGMEEAADEAIALRNRIVRRQIAWAYGLGEHLRGRDVMTAMRPWLDAKDLHALQGYTNKPAALLNLHAYDIDRGLAAGWINRYQQVAMDTTLSKLCDAQGKCERIKNTVFPSTYSMYIHFSLLLFIGLLPFSLNDYFGVVEIIAVTAISACFLLIEKMAIHLQDPFDNRPTDTPVTTIAGNIERDLLQTIQDNPMPYYAPTVREGEYFVM